MQYMSICKQKILILILYFRHFHDSCWADLLETDPFFMYVCQDMFLVKQFNKEIVKQYLMDLLIKVQKHFYKQNFLYENSNLSF